MTKEELEKLILVDKLSYIKIGKMFGVTDNAIKRRARRLGIKLPQRRKVSVAEMEYLKRDKKTRLICPFCGKEFVKKRKGHKFCSVRCGGLYGSQYAKKHRKRNAKPIWDGVERKNMWKIRGTAKTNGYLFAMCPEHPNAASTGYVLLHRLIMENHIGRLLRENEVVHHIDGNKINNKIENLMLLTNSEHSRLHSEMRKKNRIDLHNA